MSWETDRVSRRVATRYKSSVGSSSKKAILLFGGEEVVVVVVVVGTIASF